MNLKVHTSIDAHVHQLTCVVAPYDLVSRTSPVSEERKISFEEAILKGAGFSPFTYVSCVLLFIDGGFPHYVAPGPA